MKFDDVISRLREKQHGVGGRDMFFRQPHCEGCEPEIDLEYIAHAVIAEFGMHVSATTGEVCDPRPAPPIVTKQSGVRWSGQQRRRGRR